MEALQEVIPVIQQAVVPVLDMVDSLVTAITGSGITELFATILDHIHITITFQ